MDRSLKQFREEYGELILRFLWRQWSALGVAGYAASDDDWIIDPEALLLFSCTMARYDPRLFDEIIDWLEINGPLINTQRLGTIMKKEPFHGQKVLRVLAALPRKGEKSLKWQRLSKQTTKDAPPAPLFYLKSGHPMPMFGVAEETFKRYGFARGKLDVRHHSQPVNTLAATGLLCKLRALFGLNARCEIIAYLLTHENGHPHEIARETYYFQKTVQDALVEMKKSGMVFVQQKGHEKKYWIRRDDWLGFLGLGDTKVRWITWAPLLCALETVWENISNRNLDSFDPLLQASELRSFMNEVRSLIEKSGFGQALSPHEMYHGEDFREVFFSDIKRILE